VRVTLNDLTFEQRQILCRIAARATPLWERIPSSSGPLERRRFDRWCEVLGSHQLLKRRMRSTGCVTAGSLLSGTAPARLPSWTRILAKVLFDSPTSECDQLIGVPFELILWPFVFHARKEFGVEAGPNRSVLSPSAVADIERELLEHLSLVASLPLGRIFYEFRFIRAPFSAFEHVWSRLPRSTIIYSDFITHMRTDGLVQLFQRYPVLGRLLAQSVDLWAKTSARICKHFTVDWPRLCALFGWREQKLKGAITGLKTGLSDRHAGGESVSQLSLVSGDHIIYKPRSVRPEIAFNRFLEWMNSQDLPLQLKTVRALDCGRHGWMEVVSYCSCNKASEVERFYERAGMLLAVLHVLAVTDIHCENLIASGEHPVVVDLETLLSESPRRRVSVLDTGFLPRRLKTNESAVDLSALTAEAAPHSSLHFPIWSNINTDQMTISDGVPHEKYLHRVRMGNQMPTVAQHLSSFHRGFRAAYECLFSHRRRLSSNSLLKAFDRLELRVLLRDSTTYGQLHLHLLHPEFLEDALDPSIELEWLARPLCTEKKPSPGRLKIYDLEREAMERLDIPHFNTSIWQAMQHHPKTEEAKVFGGNRDSRTLKRRLTNLSRLGCQRQLALITRSLRLKYAR